MTSPACNGFAVIPRSGGKNSAGYQFLIQMLVAVALPLVLSEASVDSVELVFP